MAQWQEGALGRPPHAGPDPRGPRTSRPRSSRCPSGAARCSVRGLSGGARDAIEAMPTPRTASSTREKFGNFRAAVAAEAIVDEDDQRTLQPTTTWRCPRRDKSSKALMRVFDAAMKLSALRPGRRRRDLRRPKRRPERRHWLRLSPPFRDISVHARCMERMTSAEFTESLAFERLEPDPAEHDDAARRPSCSPGTPTCNREHQAQAHALRRRADFLPEPATPALEEPSGSRRFATNSWPTSPRREPSDRQRMQH